MSTQTPSPNRTTQTKQRDPLRWLIPAALLLLFLTICCIGQVVVVVLSPRDQASDLNLLSKDIADYSPWKLQLILPPIAPEAANAQAAERATEAAQARLSPTPGVIANLPTEEVIVIAAPQNAPTNTPGSALITPQPTVTPRPAIAGPTSTPVISTQEPVATRDRRGGADGGRHTAPTADRYAEHRQQPVTPPEYAGAAHGDQPAAPIRRPRPAARAQAELHRPSRHRHRHQQRPRHPSRRRRRD